MHEQRHTTTINTTTRIYQARLQVFRARERLRGVPAGASAAAYLESAINDLDAVIATFDDVAVDPLLGVAGR